jgi:CubicO group peptidase (beta-lactamase class C family)
MTSGLMLAPIAGAAARLASPDDEPWARMVARLERDIPTVLADAKIPGASIAVIRNGRLHWARGFGLRDSASKQPVDRGTIFKAASMSKPVFAYLVLKLCERGVLDLDTPLTKYVADRYVPNDERLALITARHVLSHTSGFQDWRSSTQPLTIHFTPGERFQYSGEGYSYLESVVTALTGHVDTSHCGTYEAGLRVCGTDIDTFMKTNLLRPFHMNASGYVWSNAIARDAAEPHDRAGVPIRKAKPQEPDAARYGAAGGLLTTPTEYARFMIEVIAPKPQDRFRLSSRSLMDMLRRQIMVSDTPFPVSWGLGWALVRTADGTLITHDGSDEGFRTFCGASLASRSGFVVMTNGDNGGQLIEALLYDGAMRPTGVTLPRPAAAP